jgi:endogenous inhibitor of DNA gyrase (YacG/DUF329 family)
MKTYPAKTCTICGQMWQPVNRYQSTRNKTCSPKCNGKRISQQNKGRSSPRDQRITMPCVVCGTPVKRSPSRLKRIKTPVCSYQCNGVLRGQEWGKHAHKGRAAWTDQSMASYLTKMTGPSNPAWKGGVTYFRKHGNYKPIKYVRCPLGLIAMARQDGYVMEHRLIMARLTGYPLRRTEVVHHIDHDPQNNQPTNLELWPTNQDHKLWEAGRFVPGVACRCFPMGSAQP